MGEIKYACLITKDEPKKRYCKTIDVIYRSKKYKKHICPRNALDFDENEFYQVYWRSCNKICKVEDKCCTFYKANIISLGVSEKDALEAAEKREKRFRFKKKLSTSESTLESSGSTDDKEVNLSQKSKALKRKANDVNTSNIVQKYKKNIMMQSRERLELDENIQEVIEDTENLNTCNSAKTLSISVPRIPLSLKQSESSLSKEEVLKSPSLSKPLPKSPPKSRSKSPPKSRSMSQSETRSKSPTESQSQSPPKSRTKSESRSKSPSSSPSIIHRSSAPSVRSQSSRGSRSSSGNRSRSPSRGSRSSSGNSSRSPSTGSRSSSGRRSRSPSRSSRSSSGRRSRSPSRDSRSSSGTSSRSPSRGSRSSSGNRSRSPSRSSRSSSGRRSRSPSRDSRASSGRRSRSPSRGSRSSSGRRSRSRSPRPRVEADERVEQLQYPSDSDIDEAERDVHFPCLQKYNARLYRQYQKYELLVPPAVRERHNRYDNIEIRRGQVIERMVYLGLGILVGKDSFSFMKQKRFSKFVRELAMVLWKRALANICLDYNKTKNSIPNRSPVRLANPRKLELFLSLTNDYINEDDRYKDKSKGQKRFLMKDSIKRLSIKISDERRRLL